MILLTGFGFTLLFQYVLSLIPMCPPEDALPPCTCEDRRRPLEITCENLFDLREFKKVIEQSEEYEVGVLTLKRSFFPFLPGDLFRNSSFKIFRLIDSAIYSLTDGDFAFQGLEDKFEVIEISNSGFLNHWKWSHLSKLQKVYEISIKDSDLDAIQDMSPIKHFPLGKIEMTGNLIEYIHPEAFASFDLVILNLQGNRIMTMTRSMFPEKALSLGDINLSHNRIRFLPDDIFTNMRLEVLDISSNLLTTINEQWFKPSLSVIYNFNAKDNPITCDCRISWIVKNKENFSQIDADCQEPSSLRGRHVLELKEDEVLCWKRSVL